MSEIESSITEQHNANAAAAAYHDDINQKNDNDEDVLKFMDSLDSYLLLLDELSSTLRQGWFDFASARYSMGTSRVNSVLLDLKEHSAATRLELEKGDEPHFTLCKWVSEDAADSEKMNERNSGLQQKSESMRQRHKDVSQTTAKEDSSPSGSSNPFAQVQKERSKSLAVFGALGSPKLGAAQLSFETALEKLVEIANMRASMLHAFEQVRQRIDSIED